VITLSFQSFVPYFLIKFTFFVVLFFNTSLGFKSDIGMHTCHLQSARMQVALSFGQYVIWAFQIDGKQLDSNCNCCFFSCVSCKSALQCENIFPRAKPAPDDKMFTEVCVNSVSAFKTSYISSSICGCSGVCQIASMSASIYTQSV